MIAPPQDLEAEAAVLGAVMFSPGTLSGMVGPDHRLRPEHFYREDYGALFGVMLGLSERNEPVDPITLKGECRRIGLSEALVEYMAGACPDPGNWASYVKAVKGAARRRQILHAGLLLSEAAEDDRPELIAEAERLIAEHESSTTVYTPERQAADFLEGNLAPVLAPWPWEKLNELAGGGYRAGQATFYGGWTNHAKSPAIDETLLLGRSTRKLKTALYINEMSESERAQRFAAQLSSAGFERIRDGALDAAEREKVAASLAKHSIPILNVAGWTVDDVCRDIKRAGWENVGVDGLHMFDLQDESQISRAAVRLAQCAKQTGCHIHIAGHLNEKRAEEGTYPPPVLRDIRGSGHIKNAMDNVIFVWREQTEDGFILPQGRIYAAKGRNMRLGGTSARYDGEHMRWEA